MLKAIAVALMMMLAGAGVASAQDMQTKMNFASRQAEVINNAPQLIELSGFKYSNVYRNSSFRLTTDLAWTNRSSQPVLAFEVVILRYDPFNRPISGGGTWMINGKNSGDWSPLQPGEKSADGLIGYDSQPVMTSVAYVRAVRLADGTVWTANIPEVSKLIQSKLPQLHELGEINPKLEPKKP